MTFLAAEAVLLVLLRSLGITFAVGRVAAASAGALTMLLDLVVDADVKDVGFFGAKVTGGLLTLYRQC